MGRVRWEVRCAGYDMVWYGVVLCCVVVNRGGAGGAGVGFGGGGGLRHFKIHSLLLRRGCFSMGFHEGESFFAVMAWGDKLLFHPAKSVLKLISMSRTSSKCA